MRLKFLKIENKREGQVMLLTVLTMGSILLSISMVSGLLMLYQIRGANDFVNSAKALFAADAGLELLIWCNFKGSCGFSPPPIIFDDNPRVYTNAFSSIAGTPPTLQITSQGFAGGGRIIRTLEAVFQ